VLTQFLHNILYGEPIKLVDGGTQRRSFTYISDGIDALMAILENRGGAADGGIFNVGNPANDLSIRELAERMIASVASYPGFEDAGRRARIVEISSDDYYGAGYQDILTRVPSIRRAARLLGWGPKVSLEEGIRRTLDFYLQSRRPAP
jgi:nucleoside-diphosphate-sugar epimerase